MPDLAVVIRDGHRLTSRRARLPRGASLLSFVLSKKSLDSQTRSGPPCSPCLLAAPLIFSSSPPFLCVSPHSPHSHLRSGSTPLRRPVRFKTHRFPLLPPSLHHLREFEPSHHLCSVIPGAPCTDPAPGFFEEFEQDHLSQYTPWLTQ